MVILTLAGVLTGMAVGLRFRVFAIVPAIIIAAVSTVAILAAQGIGSWTILGAAVLNGAAVQIGYLCGTFAHAVLRETWAPATVSASVTASPQSTQAYNRQDGVGIPAQ